MESKKHFVLVHMQLVMELGAAGSILKLLVETLVLGGASPKQLDREVVSFSNYMQAATNGGHGLTSYR
ncbi:conserved hypothetical protein [Ricinus communis]|uniref:Uncharacterized protein n=1 Tax=Ricinus communis TaxID=3988 RepID=B9S8M4_RICCO|nr:conserved hypothetical protein [Ricinus communis]